MRLLLCGVRGSTPAPGPEFSRYGGNTSCIAVAADAGPPRLVLDAGTGLSRLSHRLDGQPFRGTLLLSHLHWDHTHGLPFFAAGDHPGAEVTLLMPDQGDDAAAVLSRCMAPPHFPIRPDELQGRWGFAGIGAGEHAVEGFSVLAREIPHKGGRTFGYRVADGRSSIAYLPDHGPTGLGPGPDGVGEYHPAALRLAEGVDLLVHDAQLTADELASRANGGHSAIEYAVGLAERAGVGRLLLFHHDPSRTDDHIDALLSRFRSRFTAIDAAAEGVSLELAGRTAGTTVVDDEP